MARDPGLEPGPFGLEDRRAIRYASLALVQDKGFEPLQPAWKAGMLVRYISLACERRRRRGRALVSGSTRVYPQSVSSAGPGRSPGAYGHGADGEDRTLNLLFTKQLLCQLSYVSRSDAGGRGVARPAHNVPCASVVSQQLSSSTECPALLCVALVAANPFPDYVPEAPPGAAWLLTSGCRYPEPHWWTWPESNRQPSPCRGVALPIAPQAHTRCARPALAAGDVEALLQPGRARTQLRCSIAAAPPTGASRTVCQSLPHLSALAACSSEVIP